MSYTRFERRTQQMQAIIGASDYMIDAMLSVREITTRAAVVSHPASYGLISIGLLFVFLVKRSFGKMRKRKKPKDNTLQHLTGILVPTRVSWEHQYSKLFNYTKSEKAAVIRLSLSFLVRNLCNGSLELRDDRDFQALLSGNLRVSSGWLVSLKIEISWWLRLFCYLAFDKCHLGTCRSRSAALYMRSLNPGSGCSQELIGLLKRAGVLLEREAVLSKALFYDLDLAYHSHLRSVICNIKRSQMKTGSITILEFTTLGLHVSHLSSLYLICAVPYLEDESESRKRTLTPLQTSLQRIIELLSDSAFEIRSVCDVSLMHAEELRKRSRHRAIRTGIEHWQKRRLLLAWEAALFMEGHLVRWQVCCTCSR
ncbi:hypothetical protein AX14_006359 [Amanita brunnescens Koide BX004]|nr:hypothetical protein AX14_012511 [Amanita brunnescens Koide BX004]KAF8729130.1 hypothetical protein AX14_006359 [Amanita brunnescens Koide BX004]